MDALPPDTEIVVTAPRLPEAPGARAFSTQPIDPRALEEAIRLDDALRTVPGVSLFRRTSSAAANPTIQGLSVRASAPSGAGRVLVTLDGAPLNDPFGGWVIWAGAPPEIVAGVQVIRGAGAGPYGAGALLGAVQLEERQGAGAALTLEGGELGYQRIAGFADAQNGDLSFLLAASAEQDDGWIPVRARRGAADVALASHAESAVARIQWRRDGRVLSARLSGYGEDKSAGLAGADSRVSGGMASLTLAAPDGPVGWRIQAWAMRTDLANTSVATALDRSTTTPANDQYATPATGWGANAALRWTGAASGVEVGADVRASDGETRELFRFQGGAFTRDRVAGGETLVGGAYVEAWRNAGPWLLAGGARLDQWRAQGGRRIERDLATLAPTLSVTPPDNETNAPTARIGVRYDLGADLYWRTAAYAGFRPPTLNELHRPFRVGNDVTEANAALEPERLSGVDAAIGGARWSVGVFATRLEDAIVNVTLGAGPGNFPVGAPLVFVPAGGAFRQRQNAGTIDATGLEAEAHGDWGPLGWRAALNYTDARIGDLRPAQSPEWSASAGLGWNIGAATRLAADLSYESERFEDDLNTRTLGAATVLNVRAERALTPRMALYAALDNASDEKVETAETADGVESFGAPRRFRIGLRLSTPRAP